MAATPRASPARRTSSTPSSATAHRSSRARRARWGCWSRRFSDRSRFSSSAAGTGLWDHTAVIGTGGKSLTAWKKVGQTVGPLRQKFNKCRPTSLRVEGSSANKVVKGTPQLLSIDPGEIFTTDPVATIDTDDALLHTEGVGRYKIDGQVYDGASQWALVINDSITPRYGDDIRPHAMGYGAASIALEGVTIGLTPGALTRYYQQIYGVSSPPVGAKPIGSLPGLGSFEVDLRKGWQYRITITGSPTGGSFTLNPASLGATAAIPWNATPAQMQAALEAIVGVGNVTCTGTTLPAGSIKVVFKASLATMVKVDSLTGGTTPASVITNDSYYRGLKITVPAVRWTPDMAIAGNVEGGPTEIALGAQVRPPASGQMITVVTRTGDSGAYTAAT